MGSVEVGIVVAVFIAAIALGLWLTGRSRH
jgi:hypothetical protein